VEAAVLWRRPRFRVQWWEGRGERGEMTDNKSQAWTLLHSILDMDHDQMGMGFFLMIISVSNYPVLFRDSS
jgi:hypothetical protein